MRVHRGVRDVKRDGDDRRDFVRYDDEENVGSRPHSSPIAQWADWSQQFFSSLTASTCRDSSVSSEVTEPRAKLAVTERELVRTRELLLQYKQYVEKRLLRQIQKLEEEYAQRGKFCERLKRDNALLLEEMDRYRVSGASTAGTFCSNGLKRQHHPSPPGNAHQASLFSYPTPLSPPLPLPEREGSTKGVLEMLRSRESTLLQQLHEERNERERLELEHAEAMRSLQEKVAELEEKRRVGIDATTIQNLREVLARRDDEIRQLRKLHGFSIVEPLEEDESQGIEDSAMAELKQAARDALEFVAAINATATNKIETHTIPLASETGIHFKDVEELWKETICAIASFSDGTSNLSHQPLVLQAVAKSVRCAMEAEHNQMALFLRQLFYEIEEMHKFIERERRERDLERQVAAHRLCEVEEESTALVQRLQRELSEAAQRASSWVALEEPVVRQRREKSSPTSGMQRCDVATQTMPSVQLSGLLTGGMSSFPVPQNGAYKPLSDDLGHLLHEMEALERDNNEKSALIAKLRQQRERFFGSVDAELALSFPERTALATSFPQYLLE
ncbi:hypothetical protein TCDM_01919 [Trypanosoma cruzi Dm28c]|uniref:Uncharacterized protein n=1 Tax=Trypanosoma cruzi Dm28c TaxID=1416333 RepID=V5BT64_TRYCR|nr:hypothetical protein TCDM_01919 [Trypanosoma cruzi Dm28c]